MSVITLTTDMGLKDYYVASVKGMILCELPDARIIDISHNIAPFDIAQASYVLKNCYMDFPEGTVNVIGVNPEKTDTIKHLLVKANDRFFIGADNGIFSLLFTTQPQDIFELTIEEDDELQSFPTKNVFIKAACHIARGGTPEMIGRRVDSFEQRHLFQATADTDVIKGTVAYIDAYGNVITNISRTLFQEIGKGRKFKLYLTRAGYAITKISNKYNEVPEGEKVALFSSNGHLEIAINRGVEGSGGGANKLFGLKLNDTITIEFKDEEKVPDNMLL